MRTTCIECVEKHVGAARVVLSEVFQGYGQHYLDVVGELNEAEKESLIGYPDLASKIRDARKSIQLHVPAAMIAENSTERENHLNEVASDMSDLYKEVLQLRLQLTAEGKDVSPAEQV